MQQTTINSCLSTPQRGTTRRTCVWDTSPCLTSSTMTNIEDLRETRVVFRLQAEEHSKKFSKQLKILREEKEFSDVVLKADDGKEFPCHRVVLAAASSYFKAMFSLGMMESCSATVPLKGMNSDTLSSLIQYMYSGSLDITTNNVQSLVENCQPLDFTEIIEACEVFMMKQLCPSNCLGFKKFAELYGLKDLTKAAQSMTMKEFLHVARTTEFSELAVDEVVNYISDSALKVKTEDPVFEAVCGWVRADSPNREAHFAQIAAKVRFPFCSKGYFSCSVVPSLYMSTPECAAFLQEACIYHMLPEQRDRLHSHRTEPRNEFPLYTSLVIFGGTKDKDTINTTCWYSNDDQPSWKKLTSFRNPNLKFYAVVAFENGFFITGGQEGETVQKECFFFDFRIHAWKTMSEMIEGRSVHGSVVQAGNIYVLGGSGSAGGLKSVELYNKVHGCWVSRPAMPKVLCHPLVVSHDRYLIVTSGHGMTGQSVSTIVYDTVWETWEYKTDMPQAVQHGAITTLKDKIYLVGGVKPSCMSYHLVTDTWTVLTPPSKGHGHAPAITLMGMIVIFGGTDAKNKPSDAVEWYNPQSNTWAVAEQLERKLCGHHVMKVDIYM